jgi:hypothetical protein
MQSRQFYAAITASGQLYFDMPSNSRIRGVVFTTNAPNSAVTDSLVCEITTSTASAITTTDAQNVIAVASFTGGAAGSNGNFYCPADIAVKSGERVYFNYTEGGTATWATRVVVWFD